MNYVEAPCGGPRATAHVAHSLIPPRIDQSYYYAAILISRISGRARLSVCFLLVRLSLTGLGLLSHHHHHHHHHIFV